MSEELKPCPQCGSKVKKRMRQYFYDCVNCEMELYDDYKLWWIWKELEKKDKPFAGTIFNQLLFSSS